VSSSWQLNVEGLQMVMGDRCR